MNENISWLFQKLNFFLVFPYFSSTPYWAIINKHHTFLMWGSAVSENCEKYNFQITINEVMVRVWYRQTIILRTKPLFRLFKKILNIGRTSFTIKNYNLLTYLFISIFTAHFCIGIRVKAKSVFIFPLLKNIFYFSVFKNDEPPLVLEYKHLKLCMYENTWLRWVIRYMEYYFVASHIESYLQVNDPFLTRS